MKCFKIFIPLYFLQRETYNCVKVEVKEISEKEFSLKVLKLNGYNSKGQVWNRMALEHRCRG